MDSIIFVHIIAFALVTGIHYISLRAEANYQWYTRHFGAKAFTVHATATAIAWGALTMFLVSSPSSNSPLFPTPIPFGSTIGNILIGIGVIIFAWSYLIMGFRRTWGVRFFNKEAVASKNIIRQGPYHILKNPMYDGFFLIFLGSAITYNSLDNFFLAITSYLCLNVFLAAFENKNIEEHKWTGINSIAK